MPTHEQVSQRVEDVLPMIIEQMLSLAKEAHDAQNPVAGRYDRSNDLSNDRMRRLETNLIGAISHFSSSFSNGAEFMLLCLESGYDPDYRRFLTPDELAMPDLAACIQRLKERLT